MGSALPARPRWFCAAPALRSGDTPVRGGPRDQQEHEDHHEHEEQAALSANSKEVAGMFMRVANSIRIINDERGNLPDISDTDPQRLTFLVAAAMELEPETKQQLLELRSTSERLSRLRDLLARVVSGYEEKARLHSIAKRNGHAGKKIDIE